MTFLYFLTNKSNTFEKFVHFHQEIEHQTGKKILALQTDNGGEFTLHKFQEYCKTHGIRRHLAQSYTPHKNGIAECKNRSLLDITRCFLIEKLLLGVLCAKAIKVAYYIINIRPPKKNPNKTPYEIFYNKKSNLSKLRIFELVIFVTITKLNIGKLDNCSHKCFYLSIDEHTKGLWCYSPAMRKVIISKDVHFFENKPDVSSSLEPIQDPTPHIQQHQDIKIITQQKSQIPTPDGQPDSQLSVETTQQQSIMFPSNPPGSPPQELISHDMHMFEPTPQKSAQMDFQSSAQSLMSLACSETHTKQPILTYKC